MSFNVTTCLILAPHLIVQSLHLYDGVKQTSAEIMLTNRLWGINESSSSHVYFLGGLTCKPGYIPSKEKKRLSLFIISNLLFTCFAGENLFSEQWENNK